VPEWPRLQLSPNEMYEAGVAKAGLLRIPAAPELAYEFLEVYPRTIQHYGVEVGGLRYNGPALDPYRNSESPYGGRYAGRWPVRVNPDDVRWAWFQDPADDSWHRLEWEHAAGLGTPVQRRGRPVRPPARRPPQPPPRRGAGPSRAAGPVGPGNGHRTTRAPHGRPASRRARRPP
jgi:Mu transposase-like protein